ncbi:hypothetical protein EV426DRAFT_533559 [Tirmania nivea]|nr:hypothetical protein EV426DRAFT_533559 [Tirmania nivea]
MFPGLGLGSYFENPAAELPRLQPANHPKVAVFQHPDILDPVISWQRELVQGIAPLAHETGTNTQRICLINAAYDERAGGDWMYAMSCQEDAICRRSTLYHSLITPGEGETRHTFYPIENGGIYSPNVIVHRDGPAKSYEIYRTPEECTVISVASVPPERTPMLSGDGSYMFSLEKDLQKRNMITALRIIAKHGHRNIVIGSFGSVNREVLERDINPIREVAKLWTELLDAPNSEFLGYFDSVVFIVGVGVRSTEEADAISTSFKLPAVPRLMREWFPGQYDFAYMN